MMGSMRKDLGSVGTRTLSWCRSCSSIVDVSTDPLQRSRDYVDHHLDAHAGDQYEAITFNLLDAQVWGTGQRTPRNRRPL